MAASNILLALLPQYFLLLLPMHANEQPSPNSAALIEKCKSASHGRQARFGECMIQHLSLYANIIFNINFTFELNWNYHYFSSEFPRITTIYFPAQRTRSPKAGMFTAKNKMVRIMTFAKNRSNIEINSGIFICVCWTFEDGSWLYKSTLKTRKNPAAESYFQCRCVK